MNQIVFDHAAMAKFRARALKNRKGGEEFLLNHVAQDMADRLSFVDRKFENAAVTSGNAEFLPRNFLEGTRHAGTFFSKAGQTDWAKHSDENPPFAHKNLDLALSFLSLHDTNDTPGALIQMRNMLKPDGLMMAVLPASDTLNELRECLLAAETEISGGASPRVHPLVDVRSAGTLLQRAGYALPVVDQETITVRYSTMFDLMKDLRAMGASNALALRSRKPLKKSVIVRAAQLYAERFSQADGKIPATFSFLWLSGWAPDKSQQKPLKPGSAKASLAKALSDNQ
jgi:SAM-dependent methyltransferase